MHGVIEMSPFKQGEYYNAAFPDSHTTLCQTLTLLRYHAFIKAVRVLYEVDENDDNIIAYFAI